MMQKKPLIFAHRGASSDYPENTMLAFEKAVEMGAQGFELDVQLSQDEEVVVIHDETVNRTSNQMGFVKDFTLRQLREMDFSAGFFEYENVQIPTLDEVMALAAKANLMINVELKNTKFLYPGMIDKVLSITKSHHMEDRLIVSSFNHISLVELKEKADVETTLLYQDMLYEPWHYAKSCKADGIHPEKFTIDAHTVAMCHEHGIKVRPWTMDDENLILKLSNFGVDGIITNCPDAALQTIR